MLDKTNATTLHVPAGELYDALKRIKHAMSTKDTRYYLSGAFLHAIDGKIKVCATDGHRMAVATMESATIDGPALPGVILSAPAVAAILKSGIAKRSRTTYDAPLLVSAGGFAFHPYDLPPIEAGIVNHTNECGLIDGTFPDYQRVIPRGETQTITVDREALVKAVAAVYGFMQGASDKARHAIKFDFVRTELKISGEADDTNGEAWYTIPTREDVRAPLQIGFNGRYVLDILASLEGDTVAFKLMDAGSPTIFEGDSRDSHALHVLMPMRV